MDKTKRKGSKIRVSWSRTLFLIFDHIFLIFTAVICLLPFANLLAISFSSKIAVTTGQVSFWPKEFTTAAYQFILATNGQFFRSLLISVERVVIGVPFNLLMMIMVAYPLSKTSSEFKGRNIYSWFFLITILFNGGLIPSYMVIRHTGLMGSIWALIIPGGVNVFNMLVVMNYMRSLPKELEEAAMIDGAGYIQCLTRVVLPLSKPTLATVTLFSFVGHWNSWFDGLLYMNKAADYPMSSYLQTVVINPEAFFRNASDIQGSLSTIIGLINARTTNAAQMFLGIIPIMLVYPFLQKYFTTGLVMGSVKG